MRGIFADWVQRWKTFRNKNAARERRICAFLEFLCMPLSALTIIWIFIQFCLEKSGAYAFPSWWTNYAMRILSSAAIGYVTNWIAIEMLFKPFDEDKFHPFSLMTFGWWRQGMVPKNKPKIAQTIGNEVKDKLLNPDMMAAEICQMAEDVATRPETLGKLCAQFQIMIQQNEQNIIDFIAPHIEQSLLKQFDSMVKPESIMEFWTSMVEPKLTAPETRELVATKIIDALKRRSPEMIQMVKGEVKVSVHDFVAGMPFIGGMADSVSETAVEKIDWNNWEQKLNGKIGSEETREMLREEVLNLVKQFNGYIHSEESAAQIETFLSALRDKLRNYLQNYLRTQIPEFAQNIFSGNTLGNWLRNSFMPNAMIYLKDYMAREGKELIVKKLDISNRIEGAINKQDTRQFYEMINSVAAQHLGAIQVLGYALGAIIGTLQVFML